MITLNYDMNCSALISAINSNIKETQMMATGLDTITLVTTESNYANFVSSINTALDTLLQTSTGRAKVHTDIDDEEVGGLIGNVNTNFTTLHGQASDFLAEDPPFFPVLKQLDIGGIHARILCQQDSWKLVMTWNNSVLYLSSDNGATWAYSIATTFTASLVRMAWVFKNGRVVIGIKGNEIYSSEDLLTTLVERTVLDTDGDPLVLHTPVDPDFPGLYYGAIMPESYVVDDKEILLWGAYWQEQDDVGATPINIYQTTDTDITIKAIYKFGDNPTERDDGTATGGPTGNVIGNTDNPYYCHHFHYTAYNSANNTFYFAMGDDLAEVGILEGHWNSTLDTWSFTWHSMNEVANYFRIAGIRFKPDTNVIWTSDADPTGGIYQVALANIFSTTKTDHTCLFLSDIEPRGDMIGLSPYDEFMVSCRYTSVPIFIVSNDYGATWQSIPDEYFQYMFPYSFSSVRKPFKKDSDGYFLMHHSSLAGQNAGYNFLMKLMNKPVS